MAATTYKKYYKITEDSFFLRLDKFSHSHKTIIPTRAFLHVVSRDVLFHFFFPSFLPPLPPFFFKWLQTCLRICGGPAARRRSRSRSSPSIIYNAMASPRFLFICWFFLFPFLFSFVFNFTIEVFAYLLKDNYTLDD